MMITKGHSECNTNGEVVANGDDTAPEPANGVAKGVEARTTKEVEKPGADITQGAKHLTSYALKFLSNASNETLGACFVGLGATTYLVLGRVGLVLIGVVGGVVLHAIWDVEATDKGNEDGKNLEARKRREKGLEIVSRVLDLREKSKDRECRESESIADAVPLGRKEADFSGLRPETQEALNGFTDAVIRDYVKWWYGPILPKDTSFPSACRQTLTRFLLMISNQLLRKRPADTLLDFLTNSSSIIIVFLSELSTALKAAPGADCAAAVHEYTLGNPKSSLANVLDQEQQDKKLKSISDDVLQSFLDIRTYNCEPVKIFLQQVLAGLVLEMTIINCSRPEFINEWIIYALEDEQTSELVQAIDAGVSGATANGSAVKDVVASAPLDKAKENLQAGTEHRRTLSRAEDAMDEAMQEAKRLSALIASEEVKRVRVSEDSVSLAAITTNGENSTLSQSNPRADISIPSLALPKDREATTSHSTRSDSTPNFTTFDQIITSKPTALQRNGQNPSTSPPMTLHNATVSIFDDAVPGEKTTIKAKPTVEYLLQIEPSSSQHPGWMIARKYPDFETMHEVLRRIAVISGVTAFTQRNQTLPGWKNKTKGTLRVELENYLRDALSFDRLAESEGMKRFLEKDHGHSGASSGDGNKGAFGFPSPAAFETMGKGMLDVLTSAPKGVAGGGKAVVGGVAGVFGGMGQKKQNSPSPIGRSRTDTVSATTLSLMDNNPIPRPMKDPQDKYYLDTSQGSRRSSSDTQNSSQPPPLPRRPSDEVLPQGGNDALRGKTQDLDFTITPLSASGREEESDMHLPPPPSEIEDDYRVAPSSPKLSLAESITLRTPTSMDQSNAALPTDMISPAPKPTRKTEYAPLSIQETSVAVELFFATINELYTLSSAWTLRLALLNAAKSFLMRPGNPNLEAIRQLLQSTLIESQTTDEAIATLIRKTRENALPTEAELKAWPPPPSDDEKERMRRKARKLLVEKGMPAALTSVMGAAASGEALGKVFDCLQVSEVARGLIFALVLQAARAVTQ